MKSKTVLGLLAVVSSLALVVGCGTSAAGGTGSTGSSNSAGNSSTAASTSASNTSTTATSGKLDVVKVATAEKSTSYAGLFLAQALGYFKQEGIKIQTVGFGSGADELTGLASGQIDVAQGLIGAGLINLEKQNFGIQIVADAGMNYPSKPYFELVMRKGLQGKITDYSQLKGLKIGLVSKGNINEMMLDQALAKGGLTEKDVKISVVDGFADLNTAMSHGALDAAMQLEPLITQGEKDNIIVPFPKSPADYAPNEEVSALMFSSSFAKNKDLATRYMIAYLKGVRAFDNAFVFGNKDQAKIGAILAKATDTSLAELKSENQPELNPNGQVSVQNVQDQINWYVKNGFVNSGVDATTVVNMSFANAAVQKLGQASTK